MMTKHTITAILFLMLGLWAGMMLSDKPTKLPSRMELTGTIKQVQTILKTEGFYIGDVDGLFGSATEQAMFEQEFTADMKGK